MAMTKSPTKVELPEIIGGGYGAFWRFTGRYRICKGSRASKKSKTTALWIICNMMKYPLANTLCVRETFNTLQDSCWADLQWAANRLGVSHLWQFTVSPLKAVYAPTGQVILFRGLDDPLRLASVTVSVGVLCWAWLEEAYEIPEEADFDMIDDVIRGQMPEGYFKQLTLTFNPWSHTTWIKKRFFDHAPDPDILTMTTNYKCNEWLDEADLRRFERMKEENPDRYLVAGLGDWGVTGNTIFNAGDVSRRLEVIPTPKRGIFRDGKFHEESNGICAIYKEPEKDAPYVIGADTAGDGSDWNVAQVLDNRTGEQVCTLRMQYGETAFADQLYQLGMYYNTALIGVEVNFSTYCVLELERRMYPKQYVRQAIDNYTHKPAQRFGFHTNQNTRETIVSNLVEVSRDIFLFNDKATLEEMLTFVRNEKMRAEAELGAHDDCIMSLAIAHFIRPQQRMTMPQAEPEGKSVWTEDMWDDYYAADEEDRAFLRKKWGEPKK